MKKEQQITGIQLVTEERNRQIEKEGYTLRHDLRMYDFNDQLTIAAICYALPPKINSKELKSALLTDESKKEDDYRNYYFPWQLVYFKPSPEDRIRELTKAAALLVAQIDVLLNKKDKTKR